MHLLPTINHHLVASVSIAGTCLDVLGTLYLAYDLLGGQNGPLRLVTRAVTYSIVFGVGYGLGLGLFFGVAAGATTGVTLAIEMHRTARRGDHYALLWEAFFAAIRGLGFAIGLYPMVSVPFLLIPEACAREWITARRPSLDFRSGNALAPSCAPWATEQRRCCAEFLRNTWSVPGCLRCVLA